MKDLTLKQLSLSIEYLMDPVTTKRKAFSGTPNDIKNYIIVRDSISNEAITDNVKNVFGKMSDVIINMIKRIREKIFPSVVKNTTKYDPEDIAAVQPYISKILVPLKDVCKKINRNLKLNSDEIKEIERSFIANKLKKMNINDDEKDLEKLIYDFYIYAYDIFHLNVLKNLNNNDLTKKIIEVLKAYITGKNDKIIEAYDKNFNIIPGDNASKLDIEYEEEIATAVMIIYQSAGMGINQINNYENEVAKEFSSGEITKFATESEEREIIYKKAKETVSSLSSIMEKVSNYRPGLNSDALIRVRTIYLVAKYIIQAYGEYVRVPIVFLYLMEEICNFHN